MTDALKKISLHGRFPSVKEAQEKKERKLNKVDKIVYFSLNTSTYYHVRIEKFYCRNIINKFDNWS